MEASCEGFITPDWRLVKAKLARRPVGWPWSSIPAHLAARDDALVNVKPLFARVANVAQFLSDEADPALEQRLIRAASMPRKGRLS